MARVYALGLGVFYFAGGDAEYSLCPHHVHTYRLVLHTFPLLAAQRLPSRVHTMSTLAGRFYPRSLCLRAGDIRLADVKPEDAAGGGGGRQSVGEKETGADLPGDSSNCSPVAVMYLSPRTLCPPSLSLIPSRADFEVDCIVDEFGSGRSIMYLVKWKV